MNPQLQAKRISPAEQAKAFNQIIEAIEYDGHAKELSLTYHPLGIKMFSHEQHMKEGAAAC